MVPLKEFSSQVWTIFYTSDLRFSTATPRKH